MLTRRKLLLAGAGSVVAGAYPTLVEPRWLDVVTSQVRVGAPDPIRLLQLTDLHASWAVPAELIKQAIQLGLAQNPDLVVLTGDFITSRYDFDFDRYLAILKPLAQAKPVYAVLGNHDGGHWAANNWGFSEHSLVERLLDHAGITLLHNRSTRIDLNGRRLTLAGVADLWSSEVDGQRAFSGVKGNDPVVVLAHNPDTKDELKRFHWDLMLSGHTHGGQVVVPFDGPRYAPVKDMRYVQGLHPWGERQIYTSRGVGSIGSVRLACRPEVTILDLVA